ncbi:hypothetical protein C4553_00635 [Candidatus Parcubacteria bacterium]|nr:MAG: hypothetical protein C4553_00635 [Candidatus Parcubacteria bacterium]
MSHTAKVFLSCFIGGFIGALVALQMTPMFWWVGMIAGFAIGYLAYEFNKVIAAVPKAWNKMRNSFPKLWNEMRTLRPDAVFWRAWGKAYLNLAGDLLTIVGFPFASLLTIMLWGNPNPIVFLFPLITLGFPLFFALFITPHGNVHTLKETFRAGGLFNLSPFRVYFWILPKFFLYLVPRAVFYHLPRFLWQKRNVIASGLIGFIHAVAIFSATWFRLIHSEIRLLCGVDGAIGAAIGFYFGNALIGGLAGALWGVLNYEILSIRVLKLVPKTQSFFH